MGAAMCGVWRGRGSPALSHHPPPKVCLFFQNQLFRGNRVTKVDARRFAAFCSPNLPPLAVVGTDVMSKPDCEQGRWARASVPVSCREQGRGSLGWGCPLSWQRAWLLVSPWAVENLGLPGEGARRGSPIGDPSGEPWDLPGGGAGLGYLPLVCPRPGGPEPRDPFQ